MNKIRYPKDRTVTHSPRLTDGPAPDLHPSAPRPIPADVRSPVGYEKSEGAVRTQAAEFPGLLCPVISALQCPGGGICRQNMQEGFSLIFFTHFRKIREVSHKIFFTLGLQVLFLHFAEAQNPRPRFFSTFAQLRDDCWFHPRPDLHNDDYCTPNVQKGCVVVPVPVQPPREFLSQRPPQMRADPSYKNQAV